MAEIKDDRTIDPRTGRILTPEPVGRWARFVAWWNGFVGKKV